MVNEDRSEDVYAFDVVLQFLCARNYGIVFLNLQLCTRTIMHINSIRSLLGGRNPFEKT